MIDCANNDKDTIQDRTIYEDANIFAPNLLSMGLMTNRDFKNYDSIFKTLKTYIKNPDLLIYLRSGIPNLVDQIHKRGRDYENTISIEYLSRLNERYEAWIEKYDSSNLLVIEVDNIDFVENKSDFKSIISMIDEKIKSLI